jgi:ubiquinone/menaquinone biosynthesis C-methylase UbiE
MLKKTIFLKKKNGIFFNTDPLKNFSYSRCIDTRNEMDMQFYTDRMYIVHDSFLSILPPLLQKVRKGTDSIKVLDVGCGDGVILDACNTIRHRDGIDMDLYGLDVDKSAMDHMDFKVHKIVASCTKIPFEKNTFDLVTSSQTIEHITLKDLQKTLKEIYRVLKPGGLCYLETPNPESVLAHTMGKEWWMYLDLHLILIPPLPLSRLLKKAGFTDPLVTTRAELDRQMNEANEINRRLSFPIWNIFPHRLRHQLIKVFIRAFKTESITVGIAQKH